VLFDEDHYKVFEKSITRGITFFEVKMARPKDVDNKKKRTRSALLSKRAFETLKTQIHLFGSFNWSAWVSKKVIEDFGRGPEAQLMAQINELQEEANISREQFEAKIRVVASLLSDLREKKKEKGEKTLSLMDP